MNKLLKSGVFGIVCAISMMNVAQVKADLNEDYQAIKTAIKEYKSQYTPVTNVLEANPEIGAKIRRLEVEAKSPSIQWDIMNAIHSNWDYEEIYSRYGVYTVEDMKRIAAEQAESRANKIKALEAEIGITPEMKNEQMKNIKDGLTKVTFGKLKSMLSNEYISSIDSAVSTHLPNVDISEYDVIVYKMPFYSRLAGAQKMDDGWIVQKDSSGYYLTKGKIGVTVEKGRIFLYDPATVFPDKIDISPYQPSQRATSTRFRGRRGVK